jgi:hypothetical protein
MLTVLTQKPPFSTGNLRLLNIACPCNNGERHMQRIFQAGAWLLAGTIVVLSLSPPSVRRQLAPHMVLSIF